MRGEGTLASTQAIWMYLTRNVSAVFLSDHLIKVAFDLDSREREVRRDSETWLQSML